MADAPKILGGDSLRQAYPKLNSAIDNSNEALTKATTAESNSATAVNTANSAETKADSVQTQFNQVVIEGDSSVEAAQARVRDANGNTETFSTLKNRLDESDSQLAYNSQDVLRLKTFAGEKFPVYISHNGLNYIAPINTLPAYELAAEAGYKYWEADLRTTSDNEWVLFHDDTVDAQTDGTGSIGTKTLSAVKLLNIDTKASYSGTKIPTLKEFLDLCAKWKAIPVLEVKTYNNDSNLSNLLTILQDEGFLNNCIVMAFGMGTLTKLREYSKEVPLCLLSSTATQTDIDNAKLINTDFISINKSAVTKGFCQLAHSQKIKIGAWTTDDENEARNLTALGVDIITTNSLAPR